MKKLQLLILSLFCCASAGADIWTDEYRQLEQSIVQPTFADRTYNITKYGARQGADAKKNQKAINKAIAACSKAGGGKVVVPAGTFETGAIMLLDDVNLVVEDGATLLFAFRPELYPVVPTRWEGLDCWNLSPCIYAKDARNIAITGNGTIDGGASNEAWWPWCGKKHYGWKEGQPRQQDLGRPELLKMAEAGVDMSQRKFDADDCLRPQLVNFNNCENILVEDVTLLRSPFWVIHPLLSKNITVRGVQIINDGPNGDGCDPESCDGVLIENCFFNTGDDCIAVKSGRNNDGRKWNIPSQNIIIRGCEMKNGHGGVVLGSEISGGCRNIFVENCVMDSPNLDRVFRIKTNTCRGGVIEKLYARNLNVGQCKESVLKINLDYEPREICCRGYLPTVRHIYLDNVKCDKSKYGVMVIGLDSVANVYDINVDNCEFNNVADGNSIAGRVNDLNIRNTFINGSLHLDSLPYGGAYSQWMTRSEMRRVPESYLLDFSKKPKWSYVMGIELEPMLDTYKRYGGDDILAYCTAYTDTMIGTDGSIRGYALDAYNLDNVRTGKFMAAMHRNNPQEKNRKALSTLMTQLEKQPRTAEGVYWHKAMYAWQVWLDGIFMGLPFRVANAADFYKPKQAKAVYDDAVDQLVKTYNRTLDPATGLNRHAWDETHDMFWADSNTGLSQHCWGRAQGWFTMALVEVLDGLPADYERRGEVEQLLDKTLASVLKWQDKDSKLWYQVMDAPGREGNYLEATASSMFAYSMLRAARRGYVDAKYYDRGKEAYDAIVKNLIRVNADSTISLTGCCAVAGLGPGTSEAVRKVAPKITESNTRRDGSYEYYLSEPVRDNDPKGVGPFIWASLEVEDARSSERN